MKEHILNKIENIVAEGAIIYTFEVFLLFLQDSQKSSAADASEKFCFVGKGLAI